MATLVVALGAEVIAAVEDVSVVGDTVVLEAIGELLALGTGVELACVVVERAVGPSENSDEQLLYEPRSSD